jgi:putative alpha-1,2-mannosidase
MLAKLDRFFDYARVSANPGIVKTAWRGNARYNPRNEGDLQAAYLYDYLGQPAKTQDMVRAAMSLYTTAPNGLPGGDDLGTMSGWYVLSALGLYPAMGGDDHYAITTPLFDHVTIGGRIAIDAPGASSGLTHIAAAKLGGAALDTSAVAHGDLLRAGQLTFALSAAPTAWATGSANVPRSACAANPSTADVRLRVSELRHRRVRVTVSNAGDAPATGVRVRMGGRSLTFGTLGAGRSATRLWRVGGTRAEATWHGPGGTGGALRTFATSS